MCQGSDLWRANDNRPQSATREHSELKEDKDCYEKIQSVERSLRSLICGHHIIAL